MLLKNKKGFYTLSSFEKLPNLVHGFSTKTIGDMRFKNPVNEQNRKRFLRLLDTSKIVAAEQIHGNKLKKVGKNELGKVIVGVDGLVTSQHGVNLFVRVADCLPIIAFDPGRHAVGIVHAGWKGTVAGISKNLIKKFVEEYNSDSAKILIGFGPCIEFCHYDIPEERVEEIRKADLGDALFTSLSGKFYFDLKRANLKQLLEQGILKENVDISVKMCTFETEDFYSWRRDKPKLSGEIAGIIGLVD